MRVKFISNEDVHFNTDYFDSFASGFAFDNDILNVNLQNKADRIMEFVMKVGNFGHNRDMSYYSKYPFFIRKCISMGRRIEDLFRHMRIFPLDSLRFFPYMMYNGIKAALNGVHNNRYDND